MKTEQFALVVVLLVLTPAVVPQGCNINLQNNLPTKNDPIYLQKTDLGLFRFTLPEPGGSIVLDKGQELTLGCTGVKNTLVASGLEVTPTACDAQHNLTLTSSPVSRDSATLNCTKRASAALNNTKLPCGVNATLIELGFQVQNQWMPLASSCHNINLSSTLWSKHALLGSRLAGRVFESDRPGFSRGLTELFSGFDPDAAYTQKSEADAFQKIYGLNSNYIKPNTQYFLSRGHLAPDADFLYASWQMMTYFFVNVAPQWQTINAGNWLNVEDNARKLAINLSEDLDVYTGTHGVLRLQADDGSSKDAYLYGGNRLPVPELQWKLLVRPGTASCMALLAVNNPYLTRAPTPVCPDVCSNWGWPLLQGNFTKGYVYCCEYPTFKSAVPNAPVVACNSTLGYS